MLIFQHYSYDESNNRENVMTQVILKNIVKEYESGIQIIADLSLSVEPGELLVLVGPSGCGKSTVLRMIAGLEEITDGELLFDDQKVNDMPAKSRDIGMVFQNYALYPHLTVAENLAFPLTLRKVQKKKFKIRSMSFPPWLDLNHYWIVNQNSCQADKDNALLSEEPSFERLASFYSMNPCPISMLNCAYICALK